MKKKKFNLILLIFIILSLTGCKIETVKEHNEKVNSEKKNQSSLIESLKNKEETTKTIVEQSSLNTAPSEESSSSKVQNSQVTSNNVGVVTSATTLASSNVFTSSSATTEATLATEEKTTEVPTKEDEYILVNMKIECEDVIESRNLNPKITIPDNGVIIDTEIAILKGSSVFDALKKTTEFNNIAINYTYNASFKTAYITSINNLSALSNTGWTYYVNGVLANVGSSKYILNNNDSIIWKYIIMKQ